MKFFIFTLFIVPTICLGSFESLRSLSKGMDQALKKAKDCIPSMSSDGYHMCDGAIVPTSDLNEIFAMDLKSCKKRISQLGYKLSSGTEKAVQSDYKDFVSSTMRALIVHDKKVVFFKPSVRVTDCIHELLHTYQQLSCANSVLCPLERSKVGAHYLTQMNQIIDQISNFERNKKTDKAQSLANKLRPFIEKYGKWNDAINWLDEKDVHFFVYHQCFKIKCTEEDKEIALANLFKLRPYFPARFNNYIVREATSILNEKEANAIPNVKSTWIPLKAEALNYFKNSPVSDLASLKHYLNKKKIHLMQVKLKNKVPSFGVLKLEDSVIQNLPVADVTDAFFMQNLDLRFFDGSAFVCDKNRKAIVVNESATFEQVLRDLYLLLESAVNEKLCSSNSLRRLYTEEFNSGKRARNNYEQLIVELNALNKVALNNYFKTIFNENMFSSYVILKLYPSYYSSMLRSTHAFPKRTGEISFSVKDELPRVLVQGSEVVLDFGAMNSVLPPSLFDLNILEKGQFVKNVELQTAYGTMIKAPVVYFDDPIAIGDKKWSGLRVALADIGLKLINGLIGFDFFNNNEFIIDIKNKKIVFNSDFTFPSNSIPLISDYDGTYSALEFMCGDKFAVRLDTGSQIEGDMTHTIGKKNYIDLQKGKEIPCNDSFAINGKFELTGKNPVLFDRGVSLNLGWPWLMKYSRVYVSLVKGLIYFEK